MLYREIIFVCFEHHIKHINALCEHNVEFLGMFANLRKAATSFVMSVRLHGTARPPLDGFSSDLIFEHFSKI